MTSYNIEEVFEQPMTICSQNDTTFGEEIRPNQNFTQFQTDNSKENQYRLNNQGFRSDNDYLDILRLNRPYLVAYGSSHTEGIGVPLKNTWGEVLGRKLDLQVINYGLTSASPSWGMYMYYHHNHIINLHGNKPKFNCFLKPPNRRLMINNGRTISFFQDFNWSTTAEDGSLYYHSLADGKKYDIATSVDRETDFKKHGNLPFDNFYNYEDRMVIHSCENENIHMVDWLALGEGYEKASDDMHFGKKWHFDIAELFYKKMKTQLL